MSAKRKAKTKRPSAASSTRPAPAAAAVPVDLVIATGLRAQKLGDTEAAERSFRDALAADPHNEFAVQFLGAILVDRHDVDEALDLFEPAAARVRRAE